MRKTWTCSWVLVAALGVVLAGCGDGSGNGSGDDDDDDLAVVDASPHPAIDAAGLSSELVVDPDWVLATLDHPSVQLVDVRSRGSYDVARIAGAVHVDGNALRGTVDGVSGQVVAPATGAAVLSQAGVRRDATVVVYGDATDTSAARVMWTLEYYGHADVRFLDGGWGAWEAAGHPTDSAAAADTSTTYEIDAVDEMRRVDKAWVLAHLDDESVVYVDARSAGEYSSGRIPGAISVDWTRNVDGGSFLPIEQVAALYEAIAADATLVTYCQSGARASVAYLALRWLGFADVRLYDGSWAEWGADADTPKESD